MDQNVSREIKQAWRQELRIGYGQLASLAKLLLSMTVESVITSKLRRE